MIDKNNIASYAIINRATHIFLFTISFLHIESFYILHQIPPNYNIIKTPLPNLKPNANEVIYTNTIDKKPK